MADTISTSLRQQIFDRADGRCEYCLLPQRVAAHKHEPDHVIPRQHDGETTTENLALACARYNRYKGYNIDSFDPETGALVPFFNPRLDEWSAHFRLEGGIIQPLTAEGRVTAKMLRFNDPDRVEERECLIEVKLYP